MLSWPRMNARPAPGAYHDIDVPHLDHVPATVDIIDVREPGEFTGELGHLPGARLVPLGTIAAAAASWDRDRELLVVCRSGGRSARAAAALVEMGFRRVANLRGGMLAVNAAGRRVERTSETASEAIAAEAPLRAAAGGRS